MSRLPLAPGSNGLCLNLTLPVNWSAVNPGDPASIFLIPLNDLDRLRQFKGTITDRGRKNKHKGLSEYLLNLRDDKIPLIDGNYSSADQVKRSIRTFAFAAEARKKTNLFIIGIVKTAFDEIWQTTPEQHRGCEDESDSMSKYPSVRNGADKAGYDLLMELVQRCNVPGELEDVYVGRSWKIDLVPQTHRSCCQGQHSRSHTRRHGDRKRNRRPLDPQTPKRECGLSHNRKLWRYPGNAF